MSSTTSIAPAPPSTTASTAPATAPEEPLPRAQLSIDGEAFLLLGKLTNLGSSAEGLLLNSRMIQAIIDIEGDTSVFAYPDTGVWNPERNTDEFIAALPSYATNGLNAVTVGMQGGNPLDAPVQDRPPWRISGFAPDGTPDPQWLDRLDRVLGAAAENRMAVILSLFYFGQDHHLENEAAVVAAVDGMVDWLMLSEHRNVIIEIANEANVKYGHAILQPDRVHELVDRVEERSAGRIPAGASLSGGRIPPDSLIRASNVIFVHGNRQDASRIKGMVDEIRSRAAYRSDPKPIVFNEDSTDLNNLAAAVNEGASWGYHDKGSNDYRSGFQAPPVDWAIGTPEKKAFFAEVHRLTVEGGAG